MNIQQRAVELSAERLAARLAAAEEQQAKDMRWPQEQMRAAYEAVVLAEPQDFDARYGAFIAEHGEEAFQRQADLHFRRYTRRT